MSRTSRKLLVGTWTAAGCVIALLVALLFQEPPVQARRLPDGTQLELLETTFGHEHYHAEGKLWQRAWEAIGRSHQIPPAGDGHTNFRRTAVAEPLLWFHWQEPKDANPSSGLHQWTAFAIDEHGCPFPCDDSLGIKPPPIPDLLLSDSALPPDYDRNVSAVSLRCYPRRTGRFRYAVVRGSDLQRAASFDVAVPTAGPFPDWKGQPCPVTARDGNVAFTMTGISFPNEQPGTAEATFRYLEDGKPTTNWRPDHVTVTDATGNTVELPWHQSAQGARFAKLPALCRREAWKVRVRFVRADPTRARPDHVWQVRARPGAGSGPDAAPRRVARWGSVSLGAPKLTSNDRGSVISRTVEVTADVSDARYSLALLKAFDPPGRALKLLLHPSPETLVPDRDSYSFRLPWDSADRPVDLTFGFHRTHTVEFLVQPPPGSF
ncbi:MAG: hypothetical protein K0Q72_4231 [Armatimonadetes bacterium]|nr:hypothetical protein [Armatimonadota bacterium]